MKVGFSLTRIEAMLYKVSKDKWHTKQLVEPDKKTLQLRQ